MQAAADSYGEAAEFLTEDFSEEPQQDDPNIGPSSAAAAPPPPAAPQDSLLSDQLEEFLQRENSHQGDAAGIACDADEREVGEPEQSAEPEEPHHRPSNGADDHHLYDRGDDSGAGVDDEDHRHQQQQWAEQGAAEAARRQGSSGGSDMYGARGRTTGDDGDEALDEHWEVEHIEEVQADDSSANYYPPISHGPPALWSASTPDSSPLRREPTAAAHEVEGAQVSELLNGSQQRRPGSRSSSRKSGSLKERSLSAQGSGRSTPRSRRSSQHAAAAPLSEQQQAATRGTAAGALLKPSGRSSSSKRLSSSRIEQGRRSREAAGEDGEESEEQLLPEYWDGELLYLGKGGKCSCKLKAKSAASMHSKYPINDDCTPTRTQSGRFASG